MCGRAAGAVIPPILAGDQDAGERIPALHFSSMRAEPPDREREGPGQDEQRDDRVADEVEVEVRDPVPEAAGEAELLGEDPEQLDAADDQRHGHRERRDRDVVVDLPHRLGERPAVGEVHERAVDRVQQRHAGGEQDRQAEDRVPGQARPGRAGREEEQRDLGRGVEAQAEQHAERVHLPRRATARVNAPEDAVHEPARWSWCLELGLVVAARAHLAEDLDDPDQDDEVQRRDDVEERPGDRRADEAGDAVERRAVGLDLAGERLDAEAEQQREAEHDRSSGPSEKKNPTLSGRLPSAMSLRVVLSIAAMWSASKACRSPSVYAVTPMPTPKTCVPSE